MNPLTAKAETKHRDPAMRAPVHAIIISWEGQHAKARRIATKLHGHVAQLSVIYSNTANTTEDGPGDWVRVPQHWFFGRKFEKSLHLVATDQIMLQIQSDAIYDDWAALANQCQEDFARHTSIGVWGPNIDWTPWDTELVAEGPIDQTGLLRVGQTDGIVWALSPQVLHPLRNLGYQNNNLGWGIDWAALSYARSMGLHTVRNIHHTIGHPKSRGYDTGEATQHMKAFIRQLPNKIQADILSHHRSLLIKRRAISFPKPPLLSNTKATFSMLIQNFPQSPDGSPICDQVYLCGGVAYAKAGQDFLSYSPHVKFGHEEFSFRALPKPPSLSELPRPFPMGKAVLSEEEQTLNPDDEWQVPNWETLRILSPSEMGERNIPIRGALTITPEDGAVDFCVDLACHRARGALLLILSDENNHLFRKVRLPLSTDKPGGQDPSGYQAAQVRLPTTDAPLTLTMELEDGGRTAQGTNEPRVFFIARPRVMSSATGHLVAPVSMRGTHTEADLEQWYTARLGDSHRNNDKSIVFHLGNLALPMLEANPTQIRMTNDWGHVLEFNATEAHTVIVWVDGEPVQPFQIQPGNNYLRLPPNFFTGTYHKIELRDQTGSQIYWGNWVQPPWQLTSADTLQHEASLPFPSELLAQYPRRFAALRAHLNAGLQGKEAQQLSHALDTLEGGYENVKRQPLSFPEHSAPDVSIIIPAHNKINVTYSALCGLLLAHNQASFEVILVDDASSDETKEIENVVTGITVIHNEIAKRFIGACNVGVAKARGKYVVLLNNDTEPTNGWLDELIAAFERFPNVGLAGSKLLYPNGILQDAGGIIWQNGEPWNYGNGKNPHDPRFCYARQADYLSGAAMMTTKAIWDELGGLSDYLAPMYYEDTDFAFKVRNAGYGTWFIPSSVVYHYEGMTSGTDLNSGFKHYQKVNGPKFRHRWSKAFSKFGEVGVNPDLEKDRGVVGRILFIDYTTPTPDQSAGGYAALQEIRLVQSLGYKVTFLPENLAYMGRYTEDLQKMGVEVITAPFYQSLDEFLTQRSEEFDAFYITRYYIVNKTVPQIRAINPQARILMNNADLHYLRQLRKAIAEQDEALKDEARQVQAEEFSAMRSVDVVLSYNEVEHAIIEAQSEGQIRVLPCPWVLDIPAKTIPYEGRKGLSFLGGFQHHPNVEGVEWFARSVMAAMAEPHPQIHLSIYGSRMNERVKALAAENISPIGFVKDPAEAYDHHLIFVAPLLSGAGIKGKVLSALAHGIPCILSPMAAEGIGLLHGRDCLIARTAEDWIKAILRLHTDQDLWHKISKNGRELAKVKFSFETAQSTMRQALEAVDLLGHKK